MSDPQAVLWVEVEDVVAMARDFLMRKGPPFRLTSVLYVWEPERGEFAAHLTMFEGDDKDQMAREIQKQAQLLFPQAILLAFTGWNLDDVKLNAEERQLALTQSLQFHPKAKYGLNFMLESIWGNYSNFMKLTMKSKKKHRVKSIAKGKWRPNTKREGRFTGLLKPLEELN